jgi:hypothetical protein
MSEHDVQLAASLHLLLSILLVLIQQLLLREGDRWRHFQLELQILSHEQRFSDLFILILLMLVNGILVEVILSIEVSPHQKRKDDCLFDPVHEGVTHISSADIGVQPKETPKSKTPLDRSYGVGISEDVFTLKIVQLFYC